MRMDYETLHVERTDDHVLMVMFDRPEVRNARNTQMALDQMEVMRSLYVDQEDIRVVILTARGDKAFSAGGDLKERKTMSEADWHKQHAVFEQNMMALRDCPVPVIAAVNGVAYAGGLETALNCDFIYAADHARFALTEVKLGIMPGCTGTQNLPRALGERRAKELILTGEPFSAQDALDWGLVNKVVPYADLLDETRATARKIAANAPLSTLRAKRAMSVAQNMDPHTGFQFELEAYNRLVGTEDRVEAINAFNEKRAPVFKGK
ncbi:enoyl-CoA hydratase/isomerase family protein [uncultured Tateyamaria sp.]|uniref:enoyl-CoA hydratase/isomerase family protein n=1 Tax=uncultured Tateyamaria sp. TaxID=455651 RepID=UPI00261C9483|nr:enoyl-CoA hydratase-related protein [uncultured Tateyamaria sp.]